jgi:UDP-N-acetylglucosamine--N-acetylmuramyl-(pentapeptide) pyrophosphoryl-undecaprenol N-acetylglucosamine transferase
LAGQPYPVPPEGGALRLLVTGGSQGARVFADVVPAAIAALPEPIRARLLVTQQCRAEDLARTEAAYRAAGVVADLAPFFPDIAGRLGTAHLVIARAGASTIAELECAGRPAVLVPLPSAIDDHQNANARALAQADAAWVYPQPRFTPAALAERLAGLLGVPARLVAAARAASALARPNAARELADRVLALTRQPVMGTA